MFCHNSNCCYFIIKKYVYHLFYKQEMYKYKRQAGNRLLSLLLVLPSLRPRDVFPYLALVKIALLLYCATSGLLSRWKH